MTEHAWVIRRANMKQHGFGTEIMKGIKVCSVCGAVNPVKKSRCPECGTKLSKQSLFQVYQSRHRTCGRCGLVVSDSAVYCSGCGEKLPENTRMDEKL